MITTIRTVKFTIDADAVNPPVPQYAGVQGEHNATLLSFELPAEWCIPRSAGSISRLRKTASRGTESPRNRLRQTKKAGRPWTARLFGSRIG